MATGRIKVFFTAARPSGNGGKGFGYISQESGPDVYVHRNSLFGLIGQGGKYREDGLKGVEVVFDIVTSRERKPEARNVRTLEQEAELQQTATVAQNNVGPLVYIKSHGWFAPLAQCRLPEGANFQDSDNFQKVPFQDGDYIELSVTGAGAGGNVWRDGSIIGRPWIYHDLEQLAQALPPIPDSAAKEAFLTGKAGWKCFKCGKEGEVIHPRGCQSLCPNCWHRVRDWLGPQLKKEFEEIASLVKDEYLAKIRAGEIEVYHKLQAELRSYGWEGDFDPKYFSI